MAARSCSRSSMGSAWNTSSMTSLGRSGARSAISSASSCSAAATSSSLSMSLISVWRTASETSSSTSPSCSVLTSPQMIRRSSSGSISRMRAISAGCSLSSAPRRLARFCFCMIDSISSGSGVSCRRTKPSTSLYLCSR